MSHLGDLAAALVDNELSHDARDRALSHVSRCAECHAEVDRQRRLRSLLANQSDPQLSAEFSARLRAIADEGAPSTAAGQRSTRRWSVGAVAAFAPASSRPRPGSPRAVRPAGRGKSRGRRTIRRALAGSAAAMALTAGLAAAGGPTATAGPATTPPIDRYVREHTVMTARLPFGDAGAGVVEYVVLGR